MLDPGDQIRFREGGDGPVSTAAGAQVRELGYQPGGYDFVVLAAGFYLLFWVLCQD